MSTIDKFMVLWTTPFSDPTLQFKLETQFYVWNFTPWSSFKCYIDLVYHRHMIFSYHYFLSKIITKWAQTRSKGRPCEFCEISKNNFFQNFSWRLLLYIQNIQKQVRYSLIKTFMQLGNTEEYVILSEECMFSHMD